ncbi:MAG: sialate O-acetylesterase [Verrucomicrobiota bacterium]|nr:sialate O-acetylesterase [Verrucomicrobiota bacterium]
MTLLFAPLGQTAQSLPDPDGKPADMTKPVKVFLIMGQSNTLEMGRVKGDKEGTLEHAVQKEKLYPFMVDDAGNWTKRQDVRNVHTMGSGGPGGRGGVRRNDWLTVSGGKIGIETGIGHHLGNALDEPVLILKSSIGNRSLGWDLLPPGSPRHEVETTDRKTGKKVTLVTPAYNDEVRYPSWTKGEVPEPPKHNWHAGLQYEGDVARAKKVLFELQKYYPGSLKLSGLPEFEVVGFFWWQGDKDRYNAAHSAMYGKNLVQLFKALRKEFNVPKAKMVVATLGQTNKDSATGNEKMIIDGMFAFADAHKGEAAVVYTNPISMGSSSNAHYGGNAKTYMNVGEAMGKAMVKLLKAGK